MNFKPAQFESFCKYPNPDIKCVVLFGTNEGAMTMLQKKCVEAICGTTDDPFRYAILEMDDISKDGGEIYAEFHAQSLMGGRRIIVVKNADNNLTPLLKSIHQLIFDKLTYSVRHAFNPDLCHFTHNVGIKLIIVIPHTVTGGFFYVQRLKPARGQTTS